MTDLFNNNTSPDFKRVPSSKDQFMMKNYKNFNKKPNIINKDESEELFGAYGIRIVRVNTYHWHLIYEDTNNQYEWYHTTGTLLGDNGYKKFGKVLDPEDVANIIRNNEKED